jgi:hypothetical protein
MPISLSQKASLAAHWLPPANDPRVHPAYPGRPRGRAGHCPTTSHDDGQVQTETSAGPAPPAPASSTRLRLRQTTSRSWTQRATTPTPAIPAVRLPAHAALQDLTPAGHSGRGNAKTPDTHTGRRHRTPDSGHLDARWHRTLDTRRWDRQAWTPDTGHRTLDEDADRVTTARPASGPPGPPRRATARWDAQPCSCGRRLRALDSPCRLGGEAAFQREIASRRQLLGRSAGVERRLGALLSSDECRVERRANGDASSVMQRR